MYLTAAQEIGFDFYIPDKEDVSYLHNFAESLTLHKVNISEPVAATEIQWKPPALDRGTLPAQHASEQPSPREMSSALTPCKPLPREPDKDTNVSGS
eukprot:CAMPEP_0175111062 /NCGR_PEP_ID=MMETSP0086_2-20121207/14512_1 /TAXON_ID=136419 /ORGANISM="Unknown Unknown, Strain D1" /LENGTH=96 /DNA_ID=CAMNT_0016389399 /DNA_START=213 /DNA_END=503 /DNA_ORIENTATION=-